MSDVILKVENVSKEYQLGTFGTKTLGGDVHRWWKTKVLGQEDPFLKVGQTNDRTSKEKADFVWALQDINFEVKRGEVLGIIGKNGAGKSTLLKLLSRVTSPTTGSIKSAGRMASLLEVGTGFHPELTGLENIYLNGAILGMTKAEIKRKLDEIIDFSGCALYIDTPVKRYSSGMKVRLGFAVAAFLDPEILVVDEVLAVGDADFQKKAIGKMKDVSQGEGRTVLFVSHNMASVKALCSRGLVLDNGKVTFSGKVNDALDHYSGLILGTVTEISRQNFKRRGSMALKFTKIEFFNGNDVSVSKIISGDKLKIALTFITNREINPNLFKFSLLFQDKLGINVAAIVSDEVPMDFTHINRSNKIILEIPILALRGEVYNICINTYEGTTRQEDELDSITEGITLEVEQGDFFRIGKTNRRGYGVFLNSEIKLISNDKKIYLSENK